MIAEKSLVIYKNRPAIVTGIEGEKINIAVFGGGAVKVREKDIEVIHPGPCMARDLETPLSPEGVREAWELLVGDDAVPAISLKELAELAYGVFSPRSAWAVRELLTEGLYFTGDNQSIKPRPRSMVEEDEKKREEKLRETGDRAAFLEKLKNLPPFKGSSLSASPGAHESLLSENDRRFLQDVEALARGQSGKSRTLKDLGKSETPEEAHRLLLASGAWTVWENPHPNRFGLGRDSAKNIPPPPPEEKRLDLTGLAAYAIDSPWSDDPDDAVSLEGPNPAGCYCLWVHVSDPAASILPGSPADVEARDRGATLYLPEGASRMLAPEALSLFALGVARQNPSGPVSEEPPGLAGEDSSETGRQGPPGPGRQGPPGPGEVSPALSFKISLNADLSIGETGIIPSLVKVTRLSYTEADELIAGGSAGAGATLAALADLAERNVERRLDTGAVMIELPDVHIHVSLGGRPEENKISVEPVASFRSADMVRECMIWAGEGAARWALQKKIPFPFISQEAGELPAKRLPGFAGAWQLRRCMRPRNLSAKPGVHWGLGLDEYTQVTSPLRRYTDLLCHQQIRSFLRGQEPLGEEEVLFRAAAAEAAAAAASRAEKASRAHWMAVYLSDIKNSSGDAAGNNGEGRAGIWEGVVLDRKGNKGTVIIPALGLETQVNLRGAGEPNDTVSLGLSSVKIPEGEAGFTILC